MHDGGCTTHPMIPGWLDGATPASLVHFIWIVPLHPCNSATQAGWQAGRQAAPSHWEGFPFPLMAVPEHKSCDRMLAGSGSIFT